jgi:excisionase family DNA binding protein
MVSKATPTKSASDATAWNGLFQKVRRPAGTARSSKEKNARSQDAEGIIDLLTVAQVAAAYRVHPKTVRTWIKSKLLRAVRNGRLLRISQHALREFLSNNEE